MFERVAQGRTQHDGPHVVRADCRAVESSRGCERMGDDARGLAEEFGREGVSGWPAKEEPSPIDERRREFDQHLASDSVGFYESINGAAQDRSDTDHPEGQRVARLVLVPRESISFFYSDERFTSQKDQVGSVMYLRGTDETAWDQSPKKTNPAPAPFTCSTVKRSQVSKSTTSAARIRPCTRCRS